jgi:hypothetical protein
MASTYTPSAGVPGTILCTLLFAGYSHHTVCHSIQNEKKNKKEIQSFQLKEELLENNISFLQR